MKHLLSILLSLSLFSASAQCPGDRYATQLFDEVSVTSDLVYGSNTNIFNINEDLKMDVYEALGDTMTGRALILFAHGGSFLFGDKADPPMVLIGSDFAKMGYVTASINYRLGMTQNPIIDLPDSVDAFAAIVRAVHDLKAAIRWFKKDVFEGTNQFNIDPNQIFLAGFSAGGFMVLHQAYMDEESEWPTFPASVVGVDGGIEGLSGNPGYDTDFIAGLSLAGAIGDTSWIQPGDEPMMSTHGTDDDVVPYGSEVLSFTLGSLTLNIALVHGSSSVHARLDHVGVPNCFTTYPGQGHVPESDLGPYYDTTSVKARNFFYSILCQGAINCDYEELVTGIAAQSFESNLLLYPNPFNDYITIDGLDKMNVSSIELYTINGQKISEWTRPTTNRLELSFLDQGMYLLKINSPDKGSITMKLTKQ